MKILFANLWDSFCDLDFGSHIGGIISVAAFWDKSDRLPIFTNNACVVGDNSSYWGLQYCEVLSLDIQSYISLLLHQVLQEKSKGWLDSARGCSALHYRYDSCA